MLPILLTMLLMMTQPAIVLYDKMVMESAASEACRLMATLPSSQKGYCEDFVRRRLGAVPQHEWFHVHEGDDCSWSIDVQGDEASEMVTVSISTLVKPLPLLGLGVDLIGAANDEGCVELRVSASLAPQPDWVVAVVGGRNPSSWVGDWVG